MQLAESIRGANLQTVPCLPEQGYFVGYGVEVLLLVVLLHLVVLDDHAIVIDGHLLDGGVTAVGGEEGRALDLEEDLGFPDG